MANDNVSLGKASLWSAIIGFVLPMCLALLAAIFIENRDEPPTLPQVLCGILLTIVELLALGCGIASRRTVTGKAGLVISAIMLLLPITVLVLILIPGGK
jgi:hypothetical protein